MDKAQRLLALATEHTRGNIFVTGEAMREAALLHTKDSWKHRGTPQYPQMQEAIKGIWDSYSAVAQMYYLHLEQDFYAYYRSLPFWKKRKARKNRQQYMANRHTQLVNEAHVLIDAILDDTDYPTIYGAKK